MNTNNNIQIMIKENKLNSTKNKIKLDNSEAYEIL